MYEIYDVKYVTVYLHYICYSYGTMYKTNAQSYRYSLFVCRFYNHCNGGKVNDEWINTKSDNGNSSFRSPSLPYTIDYYPLTGNVFEHVR